MTAHEILPFEHGTQLRRYAPAGFEHTAISRMDRARATPAYAGGMGSGHTAAARLSISSMDGSCDFAGYFRLGFRGRLTVFFGGGATIPATCVAQRSSASLRSSISSLRL
jgi:hypothetical protein